MTTETTATTQTANPPELDCRDETLEHHDGSIWRVKRSGTASLTAGWANFVRQGDLVTVGDRTFRVDGEGREWKEGREHLRYVYLAELAD